MIITISREFGSGGRELGKRLADELGLAYYDREILTELSRQEGLSEDYLEKVLESPSGIGYAISYSRSFAMIQNIDTAPQLLAKQHNIIKMLARKGDCVIVGRGADAILKEYTPFRIFVHADMQSRIQRCVSRGTKNEDLSEKALQKKIKKIDKARAENYEFVSELSWGDKRAYDLTINTTDLEIKGIVPAVASYIRAWLDR